MLKRYFKIYKWKNYHFELIVCVLALTILGGFIIGSTQPEVQSRQIAGIIAGFLIMIFLSLFDYSILMNLGWLLYIGNILLLLAVWVMGSIAGGAARWLEIGGFRFQPSEVSKLVIILFFSGFFAKNKKRLGKLSFQMFALFLLGISCFFVLEQPDLSTTIVIFWIYICIVVASKTPGILLLKMAGGLGLAAGSILFLVTRPNQKILNEYQYERIMAWINPSEWSQEAYQQQNSIMAIGSGELFGKGMNNDSSLSVINGGFLPESHTDFIMAAIGEELGFRGSFIVISLLLLIVWCCFKIGIEAKDRQGSILCAGVGSWIGGQAFVNLGVVSGILPNTGLTLPFVSYGLTSLIVCFAAIGIVLNVGLQSNRNSISTELKRKERKEKQKEKQKAGGRRMKRKIVILSLAGTMIFSLAACGSKDTSQENNNRNAQSIQESEPDNERMADAEQQNDAADSGTAQNADSNILIAYFTVPEDIDISGIDADAGASVVVQNGEAVGNMQFMAETIQQAVGGELFRIETEEEYPLDHDPLVDQAADEQSENARPALSTHIENLEKYDTIFVGYPNWWGDMPQPMYSFFEEYDFSGKTIIPFNSHGGSGFSGTISTITDMQPDAVVIEEGLTISRNDVSDSDQEVMEWAQKMISDTIRD